MVEQIEMVLEIDYQNIEFAHAQMLIKLLYEEYLTLTKQINDKHPHPYPQDQ